jgi:hypothetical protein
MVNNERDPNLLNRHPLRVDGVEKGSSANSKMTKWLGESAFQQGAALLDVGSPNKVQYDIWYTLRFA